MCYFSFPTAKASRARTFLTVFCSRSSFRRCCVAQPSIAALHRTDIQTFESQVGHCQEKSLETFSGRERCDATRRDRVEISLPRISEVLDQRFHFQKRRENSECLRFMARSGSSREAEVGPKRSRVEFWPTIAFLVRSGTAYDFMGT